MKRLKENMVINCKTQEEAEIFLKECSKQGIRTKTNEEAIKLGKKCCNVWNQFKENTCYSIEESCRFDGLKIEFSSMKHYERFGYKITNFNDLFKTESKFKVGDKVRVKNDLKVGDIVRVVNGGKQYPRYKSFIENNLHKRLNDYKYNDYISCDKKYKVIFIKRGVTDYKNMCIIEDLNTKQIFIIEDIGVEVVKEEKKMSKCKVYEMPDYVVNEVKKVIINEPCVVVILNSGEKGVAKCCPEDKFNEERGYILALARARKEKYLNDVVREDEIIKHYSHGFRGKDSVSKYLDKLYKLSYK